jgi:hypothetical protein
MWVMGGRVLNVEFREKFLKWKEIHPITYFDPHARFPSL